MDAHLSGITTNIAYGLMSTKQFTWKIHCKCSSNAVDSLHVNDETHINQ
jgi:hypothetical protein